MSSLEYGPRAETYERQRTLGTRTLEAMLRWVGVESDQSKARRLQEGQRELEDLEHGTNMCFNAMRRMREKREAEAAIASAGLAPVEETPLEYDHSNLA